MRFKYHHLLLFLLFILHSSCGFKVSTSGQNLFPSYTLSGIVIPLVGSLSENTSPSFFMPKAYAAFCAEPVYAKLYKLEEDGSVISNSALATYEVGAEARYVFDMKSLNLTHNDDKVEYLVKVEGCNGDVYKRPVTEINTDQNINAKTTIIAEVVNSNTLVTKTLNQVKRKDIESLINKMSGDTSITTAYDSLANNAVVSTKFQEVFGSTPDVILEARPDVTFDGPMGAINELVVSNFSVRTFHVDPNYSFAYKWKVDGLVKSSEASFNYIPSANDSGVHQIDVYVGKSDGVGNIDLTKPYYTKTLLVDVNNNILPTPPNFALNNNNLSPVNSNTVLVDISTGVALSNCASFSHLAITDSDLAPGVMQFTIDCQSQGTQTEIVTFASGDGVKNLYLWGIDSEGVISTPKLLSLVLDTLPPNGSVGLSTATIKGGSSQAVLLSINDIGTGVLSADLFVTYDNGASYSLIDHISPSATSYNWSVPLNDTTNAKLKLILKDFTGATSTFYSSVFAIDSTAPTAPSLTRISGVTSNSTSVVINTICTSDYDKILYSLSSATPLLNDAAWESCASTKNFVVPMGDGVKTIYAFTKDIAGNISVSSNISMTLDSTPPSAPIATLSSPAISSLTNVTFTMGDCLDRPYILVSESAIAPASSDSSWQACSTSANAITYTLVGPVLQSAHPLYLYAKDNVGNVSLGSSFPMVYDTTNPTLNLSTTLGPLYKGGDVISLNFSASDTNGLSSFKLEYSTDGVNYTLAHTFLSTDTTYNWTVPASNTISAKMRLVAVDNTEPANSSVVYSNVFAVDSTAPSAPTLSRTSSAVSSSTNVTFTLGSCTDTAYIFISESNIKPDEGTAGWQLCSTTANNYSQSVSGDGIHSFYAWAKDSAGNISNIASPVTMTLDTTAPALALTNFNSGIFAGNQIQNITWTLADANLGATPVALYYSTDSGSSWTTITSATANSSSFSWAVPILDTTTVKLKIVATDSAGNQSVSMSASNLIFDSSPATVESLIINNGAITTLNGSVAVNLSASSSQGAAKITQFCLKYNNQTTPTISDSCWVSLSRPDVNIASATSITVPNFYFSLGFSPVEYTVYAWVKDEVDQISGSNNSSITLVPATPPLISNITVTNYDNPTLPLTVNDTTFSLNSDVYINWNITDENGLKPNSVKLEYSLDEVTWTTIATGLSETNQSGCTVMAGANGCYLWSAGAPTDNGVGTPGYASDDKTFKIRIAATNISQLTTFGTSNNVNSGNLTLIAGNTNPGLNGSASSAIFPMVTNHARVGDETFVMTSKGELFYIDDTRGLLYVSPSDGVQRLLIQKNSTFGTENGDIANAKLMLPFKIGVDYQDNVYVFDYDRVRKINTNVNPMTITTIIGGGTNNDMTTKSGLSLQIAPNASMLGAQSSVDFHVLGNGDIWFTSENFSGTQASFRRRLRFYNHTNGNVSSYNVSGIGNISNSTLDLAASTTFITRFAVAYDVNTFALTKIMAMSGATNVASGISSLNLMSFSVEAPHLSGIGYYDGFYTGLDGNMYFLNYTMSGIKKYDIATNTSTRIYGSGTVGYCPSGTSATSCNTMIAGIFVTKQGKLFVLDNGIVRTVDDNGNVQDIFGQNLSYGENTLATNARFKDVSSLGVWYDSISSETKVIVNDRYGYKIKEFPVGGNINTIAGTGLQNISPAKDVDALTTPLATEGVNGSMNNINMLVDSMNGYVYKGIGAASNYVLQRGVTNKWQDVFTPGAGPFVNMDSDSLIGNPVAAGNVTFGNYSVTLFMGMSANHILMLDHDYDSPAEQHRGGAILLYDRNNKTIEKIAGKYGQPNLSFSFCADGSLPTSCLGYYSLQSVGNGYTQAFYDATLDAWLLAVVGTNKVRVLKKGVNMSTLVTLASNIRSMTYLRVGDASPTKHKIWYCTTGGVLREYDLLTSTDTALNWTIPNMSCYSNYLYYSSHRNSLIFPVLQNNLAGVAEYLLP